MLMTEDGNGRIRATEEKELMRLWIEDFFIKLVVFKERMDKRIDEANKQNALRQHQQKTK